ncbi:MAG: hypothetical protein N2053_05070, partial [Chitinispirillaceae bacterium]|nr:hypothetical protein [Chitinispirillaceae bacterium]
MEGILTEGKEDCITTEKLYYAQFFFDEGYGFNNPSLQVGVDLIKKINIFNIEFPEDKVLKSIKLIPLNSYVIISIKKFILFTPNESIEVTNNLITNALFKRGDIYFFTEEVPHILYDKKDTLGIVKKIEAIIEYLYFSEQALKETIYTLYRSNIGIDNGKINKEEIYSLHNILLEKDEEICKLKKMLVKAKEIIVSLQAFTTCKDNLEKEILMYITSKSWRYTRTIRKFFKIIKKIRDKEINLKKIIFLPKIFHKFKELKNYWRLKKSNLFDIGYYLSTYSEIRAEDIDPLWHFIKKGCKEDKIIAPWLKNVTLSLPPH